MNELRCSAASLEVDEPLVGTAVDSVDCWLLLEVNDPWAPKAIQTEALPSAVRAKLEDWLAVTPRRRLQLIRRPGRTRGRDTLMIVSSARGTLARTELAGGCESVLDIDLETLGEGGSLMHTPICLVCVHGRRDRCCAQHGGAVFRALDRREIEVWQTSHLGGHRFAACALWLPEGLMYGRLRAPDADTWLQAHERGRLGDSAFFRGRCAYDHPTQAAEIFLRDRLDDRTIASLAWRGTARHQDGTWTARFDGAAGEHVVRVELVPTGDARPASCGADPEPVTRFVERSP